MWTEPFHSIYFNLKITANYLSIWIAEKKKKLSKRKMMKIKTKFTQWTKLIEKNNLNTGIYRIREKMKTYGDININLQKFRKENKFISMQND